MSFLSAHRKLLTRDNNSIETIEANYVKLAPRNDDPAWQFPYTRPVLFSKTLTATLNLSADAISHH